MIKTVITHLIVQIALGSLILHIFHEASELCFLENTLSAGSDPSCKTVKTFDLHECSFVDSVPSVNDVYVDEKSFNERLLVDASEFEPTPMTCSANWANILGNRLLPCTLIERIAKMPRSHRILKYTLAV
jgi:hypothetical protein